MKQSISDPSFALWHGSKNVYFFIKWFKVVASVNYIALNLKKIFLARSFKNFAF